MNEQFDAGRETYIDKLREENKRLLKALADIHDVNPELLVVGKKVYTSMKSWDKIMKIVMEALRFRGVE